MRRLLSLVLVSALLGAAGALTAGDAHAASASSAVGFIYAAWNVGDPGNGIDTSPHDIFFSVASFEMEGTVVTSNGGAFVGAISAGFYGSTGAGPFGITWPQGGETIEGGTGTVSNGSLLGWPIAVPNVGSLNASCPTGNYIRVATVLMTVLDCSASTNGASAQQMTIATIGELVVPLKQNGVTNPITVANYVATFSGASSS